MSGLGARFGGGERCKRTVLCIRTTGCFVTMLCSGIDTVSRYRVGMYCTRGTTDANAGRRGDRPTVFTAALVFRNPNLRTGCYAARCSRRAAETSLGSNCELVCNAKIAQGCGLECPPWRYAAFHRERGVERQCVEENFKPRQGSMIEH